MLLPGKEPLLEFLDVCSAGVGRINVFLVRLAPIGLFTLTAAAAGTLRIDELSRLQAYLVMFTLACAVAAFGILPLLVSSLTGIRYRDLLRVAQEPLWTAIATGKLLVVLPQISEKCEQLLSEDKESSSDFDCSIASFVVPLAYPFPHVGKILAFVFISFAAWYVGRELTPAQTAVMATSGAISSFASPLISMPYLLDQYQLPQDLMALFILPGFITTRLADVVGVMHLMALSLIVSRAIQGRMRIRWRGLATSALALLLFVGLAGFAGRWYLTSTTVEYDLDERLLSLEVPSPHTDVVVYRSRDEVPVLPSPEGSTFERVTKQKVLRVGYHADRLPYSFLNAQQHLVGLDVELMHRLASRLKVRLEFVPYAYDAKNAQGTVVEQLESGEIDVAIGGIIMMPERLLLAGFTEPYQTATMSVVLPDHRRATCDAWNDPRSPEGTQFGVVHEDLAVSLRSYTSNLNVVAVDSIRSYFAGSHPELDGLIIAAEEGAAWNVLYPDHAVVIPKPVLRRPIGMGVRKADGEWVRFLDRWLDYERLGGTLERLRGYWVEGGGTKKRAPRWCVLRDVLHWLP